MLGELQPSERPDSLLPYDEFSQQQYKNIGNAQIRRKLLEHSTEPGYDYYGRLFRALELEGHERILNVGSGDGLDEIRLAADPEFKHQGEIVGVEVPDRDSEEGFEHRFYLANSQLEASDIRNISYQEGYAQKLNYADNSFDVVMMLNMIYHVTDVEQAFREASRVLVPGGKLLVTTNGYGNKTMHHYFLRAIGHELGSSAPRPFSSWFDLDRLWRVKPQNFKRFRPVIQKDLLVTTPEVVPDYIFSINSYLSSFKPRPKHQEWPAARRKIVDHALQEAVERHGAFYDTIERGGMIFLNDKPRRTSLGLWRRTGGLLINQ